MRFKQIVKRTAITAGRLIPRATRGRRVVLCYHSVHPRRPFHSTRPALFEQHLAWLTEHCRVASLNDLVAGPAPDIDDRKPRVAITFDDGYEDNHSYALPLLLKWHAPATFFVTTGFVERDPAVLGRFAALLQCGSSDIVPLEWTQVRELHRAGMDVGSHTHSHPNLAGLSRAQTENELRTSSIILGDQLGCGVTAFAYPFGKPRVHFTAMTCDVVRATGYRIGAAVTFRALRPSDSTFRVPRFFTDGDSIEKLSAKVRGDYELVGRWQEYAPLPVLRMVSPLDFQR